MIHANQIPAVYTGAHVRSIHICTTTEGQRESRRSRRANDLQSYHVIALLRIL